MVNKDYLGSWLESLGLGQYTEVFVRNDVTLDVLPQLTEADLKELGLSLGHRRKLFAALAKRTQTSAGVQRPEAERRQLTLMFCDLVGSTALSERMDPEDLKQLISSYHDACAGAIACFEGVITRFLGDGILAFFGFPQAHEDDAERAVRAGLHIVEGVQQLATLEGAPLQVRIGIATGPVVVGDMIGEKTSELQAVVGETPNLAARLQSLAAPNGIVISQATRRLIEGLFVLQDLGHHNLKGFSAAVPAWGVQSERSSETRFDAARAANLTTFVGRDHEIGLLLERWDLAMRGDGQVVLLSGEPGIGKSRIVQDLRKRIGADHHIRLQYQCSPYHANSALYPVIRQLEQAAGFSPALSPVERLQKLIALLSRTADHPERVLPHFCSLLSIPADGRSSQSDPPPLQSKEQILDALMEQLWLAARKTPVLLVFEDAHWIDPTTLELLGRMIGMVPQLRILAIITSRPEFSAPWNSCRNTTSVTLSRLNWQQCATIINQTAEGKQLPPELTEQIIAKADGVPLFLEELTKAVIGSGLLRQSHDRYELDSPLPPLAIPSTLHDSLTARLDRLSSVKEVAQIGATIGREFSYEMLTAVTPAPEAELRVALIQLVNSEMMFARGSPPQATYTFKHALVRDAAYSTMLRAKRQQIHAKIAHVIEACYPTIVETQPELLAHHLTEAGLLPEAIVYWHKSGERAMRRSANAEAVAQLTRGIELQNAVPASANGKHRELNMQILLAQALIGTKGYAAPQTGQAFERALEIMQSLGACDQRPAVLHGLYARHLVGGRLDVALDLARGLLTAVEDAAKPCGFYPAHRALGTTLLYRGELIEAKSHIEQAIACYDPHASASAIFQFHQDMAVSARSLLSWTLWLMGHPGQANKLVARILKDARRLGHAHSLGYALFFSGITLQMFCGNLAAMREHTREMLEIASQHGLALWSVTGSILRSWLFRGECEPGSAAQQIRADLQAYREMGSGVFRPMFLQLFGDVLAAEGKTPEALQALEEALSLASCSGERWQEAELHRLRGEMLLISSEHREEEAETCFQTALTLARAQTARSWELRAATSLARLWSDRGRREEAHAVLKPVLGSFTGGHDTADLRQARILLADLLRGKSPASRGVRAA